VISNKSSGSETAHLWNSEHFLQNRRDSGVARHLELISPIVLFDHILEQDLFDLLILLDVFYYSINQTLCHIRLHKMSQKSQSVNDIVIKKNDELYHVLFKHRFHVNNQFFQMINHHLSFIRCIIKSKDLPQIKY
jgi:hypothetical protein